MIEVRGEYRDLTHPLGSDAEGFSTYGLSDGRVLHRVEASLIPNWIGSEQTNHVVLEVDTITLSPTPMSIGGRKQVAPLVWKRA